MRPMLATAAQTPPTGDAWVHEVKWDGMRVLVEVHNGRATVTSRTGRDVTASFPELDALGGTYEDLLLDGEVVALEGGRPSFHALTERMHVQQRRRAETLARTRPVTLMVFDLLRLFGQDLTAQPWSARRRLLEELALTGRAWQVPEVHDDGDLLLAVTAQEGLEGVVSKRRDARYLPGRRSPHWLKVAHRRSYSAVVGGWRAEATAGVSSAGRLGAVLVGLPDGLGGWRYAGRVGSGLAGSAGVALLRRVQAAPRGTSPFADAVPGPDADGTQWVEPLVVVEVSTLQLTQGHRLRQPTYLGVRHDLDASELREVPDGG